MDYVNPHAENLPFTRYELYREVRGALGTLLTRGWRPFLCWGGAVVLLLLGLAFVQRFLDGTIAMGDMVALVGVVLPLMQQLAQRHLERMAGVS